MFKTVAVISCIELIVDTLMRKRDNFKQLKSQFEKIIWNIKIAKRTLLKIKRKSSFKKEEEEQKIMQKLILNQNYKEASPKTCKQVQKN